jgi:hypothetical protein
MARMHASPSYVVTAVASCNAQRRHTVPACVKRARVRFTKVARAVGRGHCVSVAPGVQWPWFLRHCLQAAGGRRMHDRRLAPPDDGRYRTIAAKQGNPLGSQCPLADLLAAAGTKVRRKRGAGKPGDYDAILPTACARRGGIFLAASQEFSVGASAPRVTSPESRRLAHLSAGSGVTRPP